MSPEVNEWLNLTFRWLHVVAGILWIGHLYFFNFVNAQLVKTYDADTKKKVVPELMPRALYWFRWGAAITWITGILLLGMVIYMGGALSNPEQSFSGNVGAGAAVSFGSIVAGFVIYDFLWKSGLGKNEKAGAVVSFLLLAALVFFWSKIFSGRAVYIHVGALFGTIMAANVWMRIWPSQRKIIAGIKGTGPAPDPSVPAMAGLRSKQNTYLSVPLVLTMVSNHYPTIYGADWGWIALLAMVLVGWALAMRMYKISAGAAPAQF